MEQSPMMASFDQPVCVGDEARLVEENPDAARSTIQALAGMIGL
jgi:hypothetical protein